MDNLEEQFGQYLAEGTQDEGRLRQAQEDFEKWAALLEQDPDQDPRYIGHLRKLSQKAALAAEGGEVSEPERADLINRDFTVRVELEMARMQSPDVACTISLGTQVLEAVMDPYRDPSSLPPVSVTVTDCTVAGRLERCAEPFLERWLYLTGLPAEGTKQQRAQRLSDYLREHLYFLVCFGDMRMQRYLLELLTRGRMAPGAGTEKLEFLHHVIHQWVGVGVVGIRPERNGSCFSVLLSREVMEWASALPASKVKRFSRRVSRICPQVLTLLETYACLRTDELAELYGHHWALPLPASDLAYYVWLHSDEKLGTEDLRDGTAVFCRKGLDTEQVMELRGRYGSDLEWALASQEELDQAGVENFSERVMRDMPAQMPMDEDLLRYSVLDGSGVDELWDACLEDAGPDWADRLGAGTRARIWRAFVLAALQEKLPCLLHRSRLELLREGRTLDELPPLFSSEESGVLSGQDILSQGRDVQEEIALSLAGLGESPEVLREQYAQVAGIREIL